MIYEHFRGDALVIDGQLLNDLGTPVDLVAESVNVRSEIRTQNWKDGDAPVAVMDVTIDPLTPTEYVLTVLDTSNWPIGILVNNVRYVKDGKPFSTHIAQIKCKRSPTE